MRDVMLLLACGVIFWLLIGWVVAAMFAVGAVLCVAAGADSSIQAR